MNADAEDAYVEPEVGLSDVGQFIIKDLSLIHISEPTRH